MITLSILERVKKGKSVETSRSMKLFRSTDEARRFIKPAVKEMDVAKKEGRDPKIKIEAVSYDTEGERTMLLELGAFESADY